MSSKHGFQIARRLRAGGPCRGRGAELRRTGSRRRGNERRSQERPAGAALRQPQARSGQCARRSDARPRGDFRLYPRRPAGGDHRRDRTIGGAFAIGRDRRAGSTIRCCQDGARRWSTPKDKNQLVPLYDAGDNNAAVVARLQAGVLATVKRCTGNWCRIAGPRLRRLGRCRNNSGASIRTRRWNNVPAVGEVARRACRVTALRERTGSPAAAPGVCVRLRSLTASELSASQRPLRRSRTTTSIRATS